MSKFDDSARLIRLPAVFLLGAVVFVAVRAAVIPKSFGQYGPYRGDALNEISSQPIAYAGHDACEACHPDIAETKSQGVHAHVRIMPRAAGEARGRSRNANTPAAGCGQTLRAMPFRKRREAERFPQVD
jgi:hypothetical protein